MRAIVWLTCVVVAAGCSANTSKSTSSAGGSKPAAPAASIPFVATDWPQFGFTASRGNVGPEQPGITASSVLSLHRQQVQLDGTVDSSPIYLHGVAVNGGMHDTLLLTTTYGRTEALDAATGKLLWRHTPPGYDSWAGTARITTATPVADPSRKFIYAASPDGHVQKLSVADGLPVWSTAVTLHPQTEKIAAALNLWNGLVIATTGGYIGDAPPYQGHVALLDVTNGRLVSVWNSLCADRHELIDPATCKSSDSAIWGRAGAVVDTSNGTLLVATGNGPWNGKTDWGDSLVQLDPYARGPIGSWTPTNQGDLNSGDVDLGSSSPVLLGDGLLAQGGKDGKMRLLAMDRLAPAGSTGGEVQTVSTPGSAQLFTAPAVWHTHGQTWMFVTDNDGTAAWRLSNGRLRSEWSAHLPGTSPVLAGGLLYVYAPNGGLAVLAPTTGKRITTLAAGSGHWNTPIIADGRIVLPEGNANDHKTSGTLDIWRRDCPVRHCS